jgi:Family of unknown function (DUF6012)
MLIHIRPTMYAPFKNVKLVDLRIDELGIVLKDGDDLRTSRVYDDKWYSVGSHLGGKSTSGILIDTPRVVDEFKSVARWAVEAEQIVTHEVTYYILDRNFDAVSDFAKLWYRSDTSSSPCSDWVTERSMAEMAPRMDVVYVDREKVSRDFDEEGHLWSYIGDLLSFKGAMDFLDESCQMIVRRSDYFAMATIDRDRLLKYPARIPKLAMAFKGPK